MCSWKINSHPTNRIMRIGISVSNQTVMKSGIALSSLKKECVENAFITKPTNKPAIKAAIIPPLPSVEL